MTSPFPNRARIFLLGLPLTLFAIAVLGDATGLLADTRSHAFELFVILFATSPHGIFSLPMVRLPEVRDMIFERTGGQTWKFWVPAGLCFLFGLFLFLAAQSSMPVGANALIVSQLLLALLAYHHGIKQILGISLVYNSRLRREGNLGDEALASLARSEKRERWAFHFFAPLWCVYLACELLQFVEGRPDVSGPARAFIDYPRWAVVGVIAFLLVNTAWTVIRRTKDFEKLIYFGRLTLFAGMALGLPYIFMNGALLCSHATEYLGVYGTLQGNSRTESGRKSVLIAGGVAMTAILAPLVYLNHALPSDEAVSAAFQPWLPLLRAMATIEGGLALLHYYLDRQIFRARIPAVRHHVIRLFQPARKAS